MRELGWQTRENGPLSAPRHRALPRALLRAKPAAVPLERLATPESFERLERP